MVEPEGSTFTSFLTLKLAVIDKLAPPEPETVMFSLYVFAVSPVLGCTVKVAVSPAGRFVVESGPHQNIRW